MTLSASGLLGCGKKDSGLSDQASGLKEDPTPIQNHNGLVGANANAPQPISAKFERTSSTTIRIKADYSDADCQGPNREFHTYVNGAFSQAGSGQGGALNKEISVAVADRIDVYALDLDSECHSILDDAGNVVGDNRIIAAHVVAPPTTTPLPQDNANPVGSASGSEDQFSVRIRGSFTDADCQGDMSVHVYVNGVFDGSVRAKLGKVDFYAGKVSPSSPSGAGLKKDDRIQVFAIDSNTSCNPILDAAGNIAGTNTLLGTYVVQYSYPPTAQDNADPVGSVTGSENQFSVSIRGSFTDADCQGMMSAHVYINGKFEKEVPANGGKLSFGFGKVSNSNPSSPGLKHGDRIEVFALDHNNQCGLILDSKGNILGSNTLLGSYTVQYSY